MHRFLLAAAVAASISTAAAQCVSLAGSALCPAFNASSISTTDAALVGRYPFLQGVTDATEFDQRLSLYISGGTYVQNQYANRYGCQNIAPANTDYYARYTTTYLCNDIIQNSISTCQITDSVATRPMCVDSCAAFALSEDEIVSTDALCPGRTSGFLDLIRSDFTICGLATNSVSETACVSGTVNEPERCGFGNNTMGFCNLCRQSADDNTNTCCFTSNATSVCQDVSFPIFSSIASSVLASITTTGLSPTGTSTGSPTPIGRRGLSGGAIAGIVIGSVVGFLLLLGLIVFACIAYRRRRRDSDSSRGSTLNQPSPQRRGGPAPEMSFNPPSSSQGYQVLSDGRVTRFSAMQTEEPPPVVPRQFNGMNEPFGGAPGSQERIPGVVQRIGSSPRSNGSSPGSNGMSSPEGVASGQSEQLASYKDYYSSNEIRPNDKVSVLWAYQPRAGDEFELERGDMLKVIGIWDDGWATGVRIDDRAEEYDDEHKAQRDSGVSNGSDVRLDSATGGEIKAFPLVCVCLPEAWRRTVEGDSSTDNTSAGI